MKKVILALATLTLFTACHKRKIEGSTADNGAFAKVAKKNANDHVGRISESGELIIGTISGPDTYFDYQGRGMGLQYALAENFAQP